MTRETRVGLLLGLIFIIAFGFILSGLNGPTGAAPAEKTGSTQPCDKSQYFTQAPVVQNVAAEICRSNQTRDDAMARDGSNVRERAADRANPERAQLIISSPPESVLPAAVRPDAAGQYHSTAGRSGPVAAEIVAGTDFTVREARPAPNPAPSGPIAAPGLSVREMDLDQLRNHFQTQGQAANQARQNPARRVYVVRKGDSLTKIARQELKDASNAAVRKLLDANRDRIRNPDNLPVGLEIEIPAGNRGT
ncbi:MAG: LysM peptidoglycan-binding domain-containing protein [Planctomycetes bacterium]|nr:LysM peptidoglycan-binding domain-containing protein [Planctomycetota bacterium]